MLALIKPIEAGDRSTKQVVSERYKYLRKHLVRYVSVEEAETVGWPENRFVNANDEEWIRFKSQMQDGDELWTYSTVDAYLGFISGNEGYAILRKGKVIDDFVVAIYA